MSVEQPLPSPEIENLLAESRTYPPDPAFAAQANATADLYVGSTFVDEGPTLKRIQPRAMGRAFRINKRTSHITVIVKQREGA